MAPDRQEAAEAQSRRARIAVAALFLTNGAVFANLLPRYPEIKTDLGMSNSAYGVAVAAFSAGALAAGLSAAALIRRYRSSRVAVVGTIGIGAFVLLAGVATSPVLLAAGLFAAGACDAVTDVAQNAHGLRVQRIYGRSIINSLHAVWAAGAIVGGMMGGTALALGIPRALHLGFSAVLCSVIVIVAYRFLLPGSDHADHREEPADRAGGAGGAVYAALLALVLIAVAGAMVEDAGNSWAVLYLRDALGAPGPIAVSGYIAVVTFLFIGRLVGDPLVDRFGERTVVRTGGAITAIGMGLALAFPSVAGTIAGFAMAGLGAATLVPSAMHAADQLPGLQAGSGLTILTWLMRIGFLVAPVLIGVIADATSLRTGLLVVPIAGIAVVLLSGVLSARRRQARS
ncbi:fucose permease [Mycobacterium sp. 852002-51152_SCH6134967]|uniref:MFS transporter n=1 Tax=Mycobacterium sp. 852002-51152_SCH6134967 TaxID=1834096 RepID=UPI0007FCD580|nr:MFS transporter [Mycobacterium sp. 852002-51152_SCH6134967]OBF93179.1 fucose permease [Mycobacterium sp. 852002-51152_SCH6134967]